MNGRIKEFERKCWDHQTNHLNAEKFAKLIIQECANQAFLFWCDQLDNSDSSARDSILKHFGVE